MSTTVKHFHSAMSGAPVLSGTAGALIAVLDACLVNGFGLKTADSVVVSGGIATATFSTGHSFEPDVIALVTGATPAGLNGEKRVLTAMTNVITFDATDIADGTATGTITFKIAPAGWAKPFSGTNLAAYQSTDVTGTRLFLRVDDTGTKVARVVGYETMSGIDSGLGPFPTGGQLAGGGYWSKSNLANATPRSWTVVSDGKTFWLHTYTADSLVVHAGSIRGFGDFTSLKSGDAFACSLLAGISDTSGQSAAGDTYDLELQFPNGTAGPWLARSYTGVGSSVVGTRFVEMGGASTSGSSGGINFATAPSYPNGPDNSLILSRTLIVQGGAALRGMTRGALHAVQNLHTSFAHLDKVPGQGEYAGRKLLAVKCGAAAGAASRGVMFFDITGPWG